ncbi:MAG: helix-turn-helix domain-containing protein [Bacteroidetes bacterium]|nr:helix-turn-helix domain-containing protein [Bacteroidota bacterium]
MLLFLSVIGIFLSVILIYFNARKYTSSIYLGAFFLLISLYGFNQYVVLYSKSVILVSIVFLNFGFLSYLIGPMLYLYVRSVLTDNSRLKYRDLWHFLPMLIFFLASLPHMFSSFSFKTGIARAIVQDAVFLKDYKADILYEIFPVSAIFMSRPILVLGYTLWSIGIFLHYILNRRELSVLSRQYFMTRWLPVLLGFLSVLVFSHILVLIQAFTLEGSKVLFSLNTLQILSGAGLAGLLISPFFFPAILYGLPRLPESIKPLKYSGEIRDVIFVEEKRSLYNFEPQYLLSIRMKAESCMKELKPYLQPDCNLSSFSKLNKIPAHHLAYYFREVKKQSFTDFRNEWRINHAKNLIKEGRSEDLTLEAIGLLSGFSSRNAFFTAFKKMDGISPGVYAAQFPE